MSRISSLRSASAPACSPGFAAKKAFEFAWGLVDDEEPPEPETRETNWPKLIAALAVEGAVFKAHPGRARPRRSAELLRRDRRLARRGAAGPGLTAFGGVGEGLALIERERIAALARTRAERFAETHPRSREAHERAKGSLLSGVPMNWMTRWPGQFPVFFESAPGRRAVDVDGNVYADLCLGDTGAMTGHSPQPTVDAVARADRERG